MDILLSVLMTGWHILKSFVKFKNVFYILPINSRTREKQDNVSLKHPANFCIWCQFSEYMSISPDKIPWFFLLKCNMTTCYISPLIKLLST